MALDRWIALIILGICVAYGYTAFFEMDDALPPFMRTQTVLPSTFPKVLAILGAVISLLILIGAEKSAAAEKPMEINYRRLHEYKLGQAVLLLALMVAYALALRPVGFLISTPLFLIFGAVILGERGFLVLVPVAVATAVIVWLLVQKVLDIFLAPWPTLFA